MFVSSTRVSLSFRRHERLASLRFLALSHLIACIAFLSSACISRLWVCHWFVLFSRIRACNSPFGGSVEVSLSGESGFHRSTLVFVVFLGRSQDVIGSSCGCFFRGLGVFFSFAFFFRLDCVAYHGGGRARSDPFPSSRRSRIVRFGQLPRFLPSTYTIFLPSYLVSPRHLSFSFVPSVFVTHPFEGIAPGTCFFWTSPTLLSPSSSSRANGLALAMARFGAADRRPHPHTHTRTHGWCEANGSIDRMGSSTPLATPCLSLSLSLSFGIGSQPFRKGT